MTRTTATTRPAPIAERPRMPSDYGMPQTTDGLLPYERLDERLREARVYWVGTAGADGRPAVRPVDGLWVDGVLYVGGSPETRWVRNLEANSRASVHLDDGYDAAILEGDAEPLHDGVDRALAERLAVESNRKYPQYGMTAESYERGPAGFAIRPRIGLAWKDFPKDLTRYRFDRGPG